MANQASKQDPKLKGFQRQMAALHLRAAGANYEEIADKLGYSSRSGSWKAVSSAMQKLRQEGAKEARMLQVQRLDELLLGIWQKAKKGDPRAVRAALAILERQARLMGLDAPSRLELAGFLNSGDWQQIKAALTAALADYPEAQKAVSAALLSLGDEHE